MYPVGPADRVHELCDLPPQSVGAAMPCIISNGPRVVVGYHVSDRVPDWDGTFAIMVTGEHASTLAIVTFDRVYEHRFGSPNDEAFDGHPLASRGLDPYTTSEVFESSWRAALIATNRVHPAHSDAHFDGVRHFVIAFMERTFECLARRYSHVCVPGKARDQPELLVQNLTIP